MTLPIDFNLIRKTLANTIESVTGLTAILEQPEGQDTPRPALPYFSFRISSPGAKRGDDSKDYNPSSGQWNSGGVRKMTVEFNAYGSTDDSKNPPEYGHEEAYNLMALWQTALDQADVQALLRAAGMAVWVIGDVADLSQLLNTGYEGRSHLEVTFGVAMNLESDLGVMESVEVQGAVTLETGDVVNTDQTVPE